MKYQNTYQRMQRNGDGTGFRVVSLPTKPKLHEKCREGVNCTGPGCRVKTGKTLTKKSPRKH